MPVSLDYFSWYFYSPKFDTGENGIVANGNNAIPLILGMMFIAWSIVQGTSFSQASNNSAKKITSVKFGEPEDLSDFCSHDNLSNRHDIGECVLSISKFRQPLVQSIPPIPFSFVALGLFLVV